MIRATLRVKEVPKDLITIICSHCNKVNVFYKDEIDKGMDKNCTACQELLPDVASLMYNEKARIAHHIRHSEHFLR